MKFSVCSYSFHRLLANGQQDIFKYIEDCKTLGMAQLDPWNAHLAVITDNDTVIKTGRDPENSELSAQSDDYIDRVRAAADAAGLPFGCVAVDGAHIYEATPEARQVNRASAYRWIDVAQRLGARQIRFDSGGPEVLTDEIFEIIVDGFNEVVRRANDKGIEVVMENHWGASRVAQNVVRILDAVEGLGLLLDTNNWKADERESSWELCTPYARAVHIKTKEFDANGDDPTVNLAKAINLLLQAGYNDVWGIESVPSDGDEYGAVKKTMALIERYVEGTANGG
jgi:sugar phosphate isomerase/epimerase